MIVAVTGHRPDKLGGWSQPNPVYDFVVKGITAALKELNPTHVITGMALGVDQWAAEICLDLGIPYIAAIPFEGQDSVWPPHARAKYAYLMKNAHASYLISPGPFEPRKMQIRNEWMVCSCQTLVAVWDGSSGGTSKCVGFAQSIGKPIYFVPLTQEIRQLAQQLRPIKKKDVNVLADIGQEPAKTPISSFIKSIKEKAEQQAQLQLKAAQEEEQKKLQNIQEMLKAEEKTQETSAKKTKTSTKKTIIDDGLRYVRMMDLDD
jgi:uncharacterized phage-like protein YoqJ